MHSHYYRRTIGAVRGKVCLKHFQFASMHLSEAQKGVNLLKNSFTQISLYKDFIVHTWSAFSSHHNVVRPHTTTTSTITSTSIIYLGSTVYILLFYKLVFSTKMMIVSTFTWLNQSLTFRSSMIPFLRGDL